MIKSLYQRNIHINNNKYISISLSLLLFLRPAVLQNRDSIIFTLVHSVFVTRDACFVQCNAYYK